MPGIMDAEEDDNFKALRDLKTYLEELWRNLKNPRVSQ
jgi:hypothetical protein